MNFPESLYEVEYRKVYNKTDIYISEIKLFQLTLSLGTFLRFVLDTFLVLLGFRTLVLT